MLDVQKSIKVKNGKPLVSSRDIAKVFGRKHKTVLNSIENASEYLDEEFRRHNIMPTHYKDSQKKQQPEYLLTRAGFSVVALGFTGKKAIKFRQQYVEAFEAMESFIKERMQSKMEYPAMTAAIQANHEEPKPYHFSNEADLINRIALGMTAKQIKIHRNIQDNRTRDHLTPEEISRIHKLQQYNTILLEQHQDFQFRKAALKNYFNVLTKNNQTALCKST